MSADQLLGSFVAAWGLAVVVWIVLDRVAHAGHGPFRPLRDRRPPWWASRGVKDEWRRRHDAELRAVLRAGRGRSSLRHGWDEDRELAVALHDTALLARTEIVVADAAPVRPAPVLEEWRPDESPADTPAPADTPPTDTPPTDTPPADTPHGTPPADTPHGTPPPADTPSPRWRRGLDPRLPLPSGAAPSPATVRSRFWKNLAGDPRWDDENRARLHKGRAPTRPAADGTERARLALDTDDGAPRPYWPSDPDGPFDPPDRDTSP